MSNVLAVLEQRDGALRKVSHEVVTGARRLADYAVADLSLTLTWRDLELRGAVGNLFDRRYVSFGTFAENPTVTGTPIQRWLTPGLPRHVQVSLSTDF